jgi:uncharacterized protein (DUF934 family)
MRVIKGERVIEDPWQRVDDDAPLPAGDVIVSLQRWHDERRSLRVRADRLGIRITGDDDLDDVVADLTDFDLIALEFAKFTDGRNYSNARLLKERYGYGGELRAVGEVLRDQLSYMARCGIDSFAVGEGKDPEDAIKGLTDFSAVYQPAGDAETPVYRLRGRPV